MRLRRNFRRVLHTQKWARLTLIAAIFAPALFPGGRAAAGQSPSVLRLGQPVTAELGPGEERVFKLPLREGDFAEVFWLANDELKLSVSVLGPGAPRSLPARTSPTTR